MQVTLPGNRTLRAKAGSKYENIIHVKYNSISHPFLQIVYGFKHSNLNPHREMHSSGDLLRGTKGVVKNGEQMTSNQGLT